MRGPCGPLPALPGALDFEPQLAAIVADAPRAATADQGQDAIRLLALACLARSPGAPSATRRCATAASRGGRVRIPALLASANLPVCARAGRQGEFLGATVAAA